MPTPPTPELPLAADTPTSSVTAAATTTILGGAVDPPAGQSRPNGQAVTRALLDAERQGKQQRRSILPEELLGTWQLRFTAPKKPTYKDGNPTANGFYIPGIARATLSFAQAPDYASGLSIQNQLQVGGIKLRFVGPARLLAEKNLLAFDFVRLQILLGTITLLSLPIRGGRSKAPDLEQVPVGELPFFAFFAATEVYLAARGRGGGLALWKKIV
jgi:hypothetical protein